MLVVDDLICLNPLITKFGSFFSLLCHGNDQTTWPQIVRLLLHVTDRLCRYVAQREERGALLPNPNGGVSGGKGEEKKGNIPTVNTQIKCGKFFQDTRMKQSQWIRLSLNYYFFQKYILRIPVPQKSQIKVKKNYFV